MRLRESTLRLRKWLIIGLITSMGLGASTARGEQPPDQAKQEAAPQLAREPRVEVRTVDTSPAAEPRPALKYRFWPAWHELEPGNAVPLYLRALVMLTSSGEQARWQEYAKFAGDGVPDPDDAEGMEAARAWLAQHPHQSISNEIRRATYREIADYEHRVEALSGPEQFAFLLPELQELRNLARLLDVRIRVAIADGDYEEAIDLLRDGFRLAGSLRGSRLLISQLFGAAIAGMMLDDVRLLSEAPGSPNLYWALATLPRPLISMPYTIAFELDLAERMLPEPPDVPIGVEGWNQYLSDVLGDAYQFVTETPPQQPWARRMMITAGAMQAYPLAKSALIADGIPAEAVDAMPVAEVVIRHMRRQLHRLGDDLQKWLLLPPEVQRLTEASREDPISAILEKHDTPLDPVRIFVQLLPRFPTAASVQSRRQAQVDAQMTLEAIRAYAAAHDGQLPERLDQLEPLPALRDPRTGEPFEWEVHARDGVSEGVLRVANHYRPDVTLEYHVRVRPEEE